MAGVALLSGDWLSGMREMRLKTASQRLIVWASLTLCFCPSWRGYGDDPIEGARREMGLFRESAAKLAEAQVSRDAGAVQTHNQDVEEHLRRARQLFEDAEVLRSKDSSVLFEYSEALSILGDFDLAGEALEKAVEHDGENARLWRELGVAYSRAGRWKDNEAARALWRSYSLDDSPDNAVECLSALGSLYRRQGLFDLARDAYARGIEAKPDEPGPRVGMALLYIRDGKLVEASRTFEGLRLGIPLSVVGAVQESLVDFEASRRVLEDTVENHLAYGKLLLLARQYGDAILPLRRAATLAPDRAEVWYLLGRIYESIRNGEEARRAYGRSLELNPDQAFVRGALERLSSGATSQ